MRTVIACILLGLICSSCIGELRDMEYKAKMYIPGTTQYNIRVGFNEYAETAGGKVVHGNPEPPMPDMEKNNSTLLGIDSDDDGIRDDVEILINFMVKDEGYNKTMALRMMARTEQHRLKFRDNINRFFNLTKQGNYDFICFSDLYDEWQRAHEISDFFWFYQYNTNLRQRTLEKSNKELSGTIFTLEKKCRFEVK